MHFFDDEENEKKNEKNVPSSFLPIIKDIKIYILNWR